MTMTTTPPPTPTTPTRRATRVHFEDLLDIAPANDVDRRWPDPMVVGSSEPSGLESLRAVG